MHTHPSSRPPPMANQTTTQSSFTTKPSPTTSRSTSSQNNNTQQQQHTNSISRTVVPSMTSSILLAIFVFHLQIDLSSTALGNNPPCHPGVLHIFNWCEQSHCKNNCTCLEPSRVCKQICQQPNCGFLFCSSPLTCHQSVIKEDTDPMPNIKTMVAHSPRSEQECNKGKCRMLKALRYDKDTTTMTFQSCADGNCGMIKSHADIAEQFCGNCKQMRCGGRHSKNCTQYCVLGECPDMTCNAKHCKQLCLHSSACKLTCGPNTETCDQVCSHNSNCTMTCQGKNCNQKCKHANNCTKIQVVKTEPPTTTTERPTTTAVTTTTQTTTTVGPAATSLPASTSAKDISAGIIPTTKFFTTNMKVLSTKLKNMYSSSEALRPTTKPVRLTTDYTIDNEVEVATRPGEDFENAVEVLPPSELIGAHTGAASRVTIRISTILIVTLSTLVSTCSMLSCCSVR